MVDECKNTGTPQDPTNGGSNPEDENLDNEASNLPESPAFLEPILESDISLPTEAEIELAYAPFSFSAAKGTWLFQDGCLLGTERRSQIITSEEEERTTAETDDQGNEITYDTDNYISGFFRVKPYWCRAIVDRFAGPVDRPSTIADGPHRMGSHSSRPVCGRNLNPRSAGFAASSEITDNIRWVSDMYWVNTEHREGPNEFPNSAQYEMVNLAGGEIRTITRGHIDFPDLLFLNSKGRYKGRFLDYLNHPNAGLPPPPFNGSYLARSPQQGSTVGVFYYNKFFQVRMGAPSSPHFDDIKTTIVLRKINSNAWTQDTPIDQWKNLGEARRALIPRFESRNPSFFKETYSVYELYQTELDEVGSSQLLDRNGDPISWNWFNYFYGNVRLEILESLLPDVSARQDELGITGVQKQRALKQALINRLWVSEPEEYVDQQGKNRVKENNDFNWRNIYNVNPTGTKGYNLNPFPIIPYFAEDVETANDNISPGSRVATGTSTDLRYSPPTISSSPYLDVTTRISDLLTKDEADVLDLENKTYFDIRPMYSYYDCILENIINLGLHEIELPSPYRGDLDLLLKAGVIREEGLSQSTREDYDLLMLTRILQADNFFELNLRERYGIPSSFAQLALFAPVDTLLEEISEQINDPNVGIDIEKIRDFARSMSGLYNFDVMRDVYGSTGDRVHREQVRDRQNLFLSIFGHEQLEDIYSQRHINSSFVEIEIGNIEKSLLAEAMVFDGDDNTLVKDLFFALEDTLRGIPGDSPNVGFEDLTRSSEDPYGFGTGKYLDITRRDTHFSYIEQLVKSGLTDEGLGLNTEFEFSDNVPLSSYSFSFEDWWADVWKRVMRSENEVPPGVRFARIFKMLAIQTNIRRFVESNTRTYDEILNGKPAVNEVMGYVIKKFEILSDDSKRFVSNIILMANNDQDVQRVVDSQVKYGKIYQYEIHRVVAVVGNEYVYVDNMTEAQHQNNFDEYHSTRPRFRMQFGMMNKPSLRLFLVPSERKRVSVVDKPPIHPDVDIIPFKNNQQNIMFNLSAQGGEYHAPPVILEEDDVAQFTRAALNQGLLDNEFMKVGTITEFSSFMIDQWITKFQDHGRTEIKSVHFKTDDPVKRFEVFRIDEHPSSILDFKDNKIAVLETGAENASFMDTIEPDKPYYYIFRSEDIHNQVSNPTDVFEIELRTYGEAVYPSIRIVEMKQYTREDSRELRQFIEIKPALDKQRIDLPASALSDDLLDKDGSDLFSIKNDTLWDRRWKLRIISKNTGKEIDINFRFKPSTKGKENKKVNLIC